MRVTEFSEPLIGELTQIEAEAFGDGGLNRWTFPVLIRHGAIYVLRCDGKICGIADIIKDWMDPGLAFLVNFVIRKGERNKGLGTIFLEKLIAILKDDGIKRLQLTVDPANKQAIRVYKKLGFKLITELSDEYGPGVDRFLYELELEE